MITNTFSKVDVLVITALKEELDELLHVTDRLSTKWSRIEGSLPYHTAIFEGSHGPICIAAARLTKMGGIETATVASRLIEKLQPQCLAMCGVCAGAPEQTELGDVIIASRVFQYDEGKLKENGFRGDLWVHAASETWLRTAQDLVGLARGLQSYGKASVKVGKRWFLEQLLAARNPLKAHAIRRYIPDERRSDILSELRKDLIRLDGEIFLLTEKGRVAAQENRVIHGVAASQLPFYIHVGPIGSGNAVIGDGDVWERIGRSGMRNILGVEMEAAAIGRVAHDRSLPFIVVKGVMDYADHQKTDRFKVFAARSSAEVLCCFLRKVVDPICFDSKVNEGVVDREGMSPVSSSSKMPDYDLVGILKYKERYLELFSNVGLLGKSHDLPRSVCEIRRQIRQNIKVAKDNETYITSEVRSDRFLVQALSQESGLRILLQGEGGSGKTEFLRMLAFDLANRSDLFVPVFFELKQWKDTENLFRLICCSELKLLESLGKEGRLVFLLDGLDELRFDPADFERNFSNLIARFGSCSFVVSSRPSSAVQLGKYGFNLESRRYLETLTIRDISRYVRGYFSAKCIEDRGESLLEAFDHAPDQLRHLLHQPFMLSLACATFESTDTDIEITGSPVALIESALHNLFLRRKRQAVSNPHGPLVLDDQSSLDTLGIIAEQGFRNNFEVQYHTTTKQLVGILDVSQSEAERLLSVLSPASGVLYQTGTGSLQFSNRLIAEFLAARWMVRPGQSDHDILELYRNLVWSDRHSAILNWINELLALRRPQLFAVICNWLCRHVTIKEKSRSTIFGAFPSDAHGLFPDDTEQTLLGKYLRAISCVRRGVLDWPDSLYNFVQRGLIALLPLRGGWCSH